MYFLTSHTQWDAYVLPVYAISGAAGLVLSSALLTSRIVPRTLAVLGVIGYPVFLAGSILAMFSMIDVTHGAGTVALVPGGLFELILPIWLFAKGFASYQNQSEASSQPTRTAEPTRVTPLEAIADDEHKDALVEDSDSASAEEPGPRPTSTGGPSVVIPQAAGTGSSGAQRYILAGCVRISTDGQDLSRPLRARNPRAVWTNAEENDNLPDSDGTRYDQSCAAECEGARNGAGFQARAWPALPEADSRSARPAQGNHAQQRTSTLTRDGSNRPPRRAGSQGPVCLVVNEERIVLGLVRAEALGPNTTGR